MVEIAPLGKGCQEILNAMQEIDVLPDEGRRWADDEEELGET
jgi:hypothetical protein